MLIIHLKLNALALIDTHGNLLMAVADTFDVSPINTAMFNVVHGYTRFRFDSISDDLRKKINSG